MRSIAVKLLAGSVIFVAGGVAAQSSQQNRMAACNTLAGQRSLSGDARKSFMSDCLSKGPEAVDTSGKSAQGSQQQRMKDCNAAASAGAYKGDVRQAFMSSCMKGGSGTASAATSMEQSCAAQADGKKLAGAARTSFLTKCVNG